MAQLRGFTPLFGPLLAISILVSGCGNESQSRPPVPDSTMVAVLAELHVANTRMNQYQDVPRAIRDSIFSRHGLDSLQFRSAVDYYSRNVSAYVDLYDRVIDTMRAQQEDLRNQDVNPKNR